MTALLALAMLLGQSTNFSCMADDTACLKAHGLTPTQGTNSWNIPEPEDIPAVKLSDRRVFYCAGGIPRCDNGEHLGNPTTVTMPCSYDEYAKKLEKSCGRERWTCADKSRVLLTAEDGKHWCHRVHD